MPRKKMIESGYYFDAKKKQFKTSKGIWLTPVKIPSMLLERLMTTKPSANGVPVVHEDHDHASDIEVGPRPEVPEVEVDYGKGRPKGVEKNPNDAAYRDAMMDWEFQQNIKVMMLVFNLGIAEGPSDDFAEIIAEIEPSFGPATIKYEWVLSTMSTDEEVSKLSELVLGQSIPTAEGVENAEAEFPGDDGGSADKRIPAQAGAS